MAVEVAHGEIPREAVHGVELGGFAEAGGCQQNGDAIRYRIADGQILRAVVVVRCWIAIAKISERARPDASIGCTLGVDMIYAAPLS